MENKSSGIEIMISKISNYTIKCIPLIISKWMWILPFLHHFPTHNTGCHTRTKILTWLYCYTFQNCRNNCLFSTIQGGNSNARQITKGETSPVWDRREGKCRPALKIAPPGSGEMPGEPQGGARHQNKAWRIIQGRALEGFELGKPGIRSASAVTAKAKNKITTTKKMRNRLKLHYAISPLTPCAHRTRWSQCI